MDHSRLICERVKQTIFFREINYKCFGIKWIRKNWGKQTFIFHAAKDWNSLPNDLKGVIFYLFLNPSQKLF